MRNRTLAIALSVVLIASLAACVATPPAPTSSPSNPYYVQLVEEDLPAGATGDTNLTNLVLTGDLTVGDDTTMTGDLTVSGDFAVEGTTPLATIGDAGAEDTAIVFDGNAVDYYIGLDDSADDLLVGLGSTVGTTGIIHLDGNQDVGLGGASAGAKLDVTGNVFIDGAADEVQLTVSGFTTQTNHLLLAEQSGGTDVFWVTNEGDAELNGTTPSLTIGDAGEEDTSVVFDGNAQDYYVGLDDTDDKLHIGVGSAVGTTPAITADSSQNVDVAGTLQYGANNLYPVGYASSGQQAVYGTSTITGTATAAHGLTTVTFALCTLGKQQDANTAGCSLVVNANTVTLYTYEDDNTTQSTEASVPVHWLVIGAP